MAEKCGWLFSFKWREKKHLVFSHLTLPRISYPFWVFKCILEFFQDAYIYDAQKDTDHWTCFSRFILVLLSNCCKPCEVYEGSKVLRCLGIFVDKNLKAAMNWFSDQVAIIRNTRVTYGNPEAADSRIEELRLPRARPVQSMEAGACERGPFLYQERGFTHIDWPDSSKVRELIFWFNSFGDVVVSPQSNPNSLCPKKTSFGDLVTQLCDSVRLFHSIFLSSVSS